MVNEPFQKVPYNFHCEMCDYYGMRESQWKRHLETKKHNDNKMIITLYNGLYIRLIPIYFIGFPPNLLHKNNR